MLTCQGVLWIRLGYLGQTGATLGGSAGQPPFLFSALSRSAPATRVCIPYAPATSSATVFCVCRTEFRTVWREFAALALTRRQLTFECPAVVPPNGIIDKHDAISLFDSACNDVVVTESVNYPLRLFGRIPEDAITLFICCAAPLTLVLDRVNMYHWQLQRIPPMALT